MIIVIEALVKNKILKNYILRQMNAAPWLFVVSHAYSLQVIAYVKTWAA